MSAPKPIPVKEIARLIWKYRKYISYAIEVILFYVHLKKQKPMKPVIEQFITRIVTLLDEKTKTGIFEPFDSIIAEKLLKAGWQLMQAQMNPEHFEIIEQFVISLETAEDAELIELISNTINNKVDLPNLDETEEKEILVSLLKTLSLTLRGLLS